MASGNRSTADERDLYPGYLNPDTIRAKPGPREIGVIVIFVAVVTALVTLGGTKLFNRDLRSEATQSQDDIKLVGASQQLAVVMVSTGEHREIKLLDTQNLLVQDVTRGQSTALTAALSPSGERLAYVTRSTDALIVFVVEVKGGRPMSLPASALLKAGEDVGFSNLSICEWTSVSWSDDGSRFLIFTCQKDESAITVVSVGRTLTPVILVDTLTTQQGPRQAIWLNDYEILFSQGSDAAGKTSLRRISANADALSVLIYGE